MFTSASSQGRGITPQFPLRLRWGALAQPSTYSALTPVTGAPSTHCAEAPVRAPEEKGFLWSLSSMKIERVSPIIGSVCQHPAPSWFGDYEINRCELFNLHQHTVRWQRHHGSLEPKHGTLMARADSGKRSFRFLFHTRSTQQCVKLLRDRLHQKPAKCSWHVQAFLWKSLLSKRQ